MRWAATALSLLKPKMLPKTTVGLSSFRPRLSSQSIGEADGHVFFRGTSYHSVDASSTAPHFDDGSFVYREALKFQRPNTIRAQPHLRNSASFIGTIVPPFHQFTNTENIFCVYSKLRLLPPPGKGNRPVWVFMDFYDKMARIASRHLKPGDLVYVSGHLDYFTVGNNDDGNGKVRVSYKVIVNDLNFVQPKLEVTNQSNLARFEAQEAEMANLVSGEENYENKEDDPLHLWLEFFANPLEWWDNRLDKRNPMAPDFVHKDTRECIWIRETDPSWVKSQLELTDKRMEDHGLRDRRSWECSQWKF